MTISPTHGGAVAYRMDGRRPLFLLVSSSDGFRWVLPKGHIEGRETPEETALRELREEAGVEGEILAELAVDRYLKGSEQVVVQYVLAREVDSASSPERRSVRWEAEPEALGELEFEGPREAVRRAAAWLASRESEHEDR